MKTLVQAGKVLATYNNTGALVASGDPIVVSNHIRVAVSDIAAGETGEAATAGIVRLTANSSDVWFDGEPLYWDKSNARLTNTSTDNAAAGSAVGDKANAVTSARVSLIGHDEYGLSAPTTTAGAAATTTAAAATTPASTTPADTTAADTTAGATTVADTTAAATTEGETTPEETTEGETTPEETTEGETTPEQTTPAETTPEETTPAETTSGETTPEETTEDETSDTETTTPG